MDQKRAKIKNLNDFKAQIKQCLLSADAKTGEYELFSVKSKLDVLAKTRVTPKPLELCKSPTDNKVNDEILAYPITVDNTEQSASEKFSDNVLPADNSVKSSSFDSGIHSVEHQEPIEILDEEESGSSSVETQTKVSPTVAECTIRVKFENSIIRFRVKKTDPFSHIVKNVSKEINVPTANISLYRKSGSAITETDSPESLNLGVAEILECFQLTPTASCSIEEEPSTSAGEINLKFQSQDRRSAVSLSTNPNDKFEKIKSKYCEMKSLDASRVVFIFDGDRVDDNCTPIDLELEDGDCIDVCVK